MQLFLNFRCKKFLYVSLFFLHLLFSGCVLRNRQRLTSPDSLYTDKGLLRSTINCCAYIDWNVLSFTMFFFYSGHLVSFLLSVDGASLCNRFHTPEERNSQPHRCKNLKSLIIGTYLTNRAWPKCSALWKTLHVFRGVDDVCIWKQFFFLADIL